MNRNKKNEISRLIYVLTNRVLSSVVQNILGENKSLKESVAILAKKNELLQENNDSLIRAMYTPKSEKRTKFFPVGDYNDYPLLKLLNFKPPVSNSPVSSEQDTTIPSDAGAETENKDTVQSSRPRSTKQNKKPSPENEGISAEIARIDHVSEHAGDSPSCVCGAPLEQVGERIITKLDYIPGHFVEHRYHEPLYRCPHCEGEASQNAPLPSALENEILPVATPTNTLLAQILVNKFAYAQPLYRQEQMFTEKGVHLPRSSMVRWIDHASTLLEPLYNEIQKQIQLGDVINMDETPLQVHREAGRKNTQLSYVWVMSGGRDGPCRFFHYDKSRAGIVAVTLLGTFQGFLQTDGFVGYLILEANPGIVHVGCLDHIRRKFITAYKACQTPSKTASIANAILDPIGRIYKFERELRDLNLSPDAFVQQRKNLVTPVLM